MALEKANNNKEARLVLASDSRPRLKWTPELHQRFVDAIALLGGADKATPKSLMREMNIDGLTLYHLKSHLQKFRLGKSQHLQAYQVNKQESKQYADSSEEDKSQMNDTQVARALRIQMEVQRKLHEQLEVQRRLQLRIEAQGKYLKSVMKKAHETLAGYDDSSSSVGLELAKAEISRLVSMVDMECLSSSASVTKEQVIGCSLESSLTSSDSSGRMEYNQEMEGIDKHKGNSVELSLMEMHPTHGNKSNGEASGRKRSQSTISDHTCVVEKPSDRMIFKAGTYDEKFKKFGFLENLDLNAKCLNDFDTGP